MLVKVGGFDSEDDPFLGFAIDPGFVVIFERKFVDVLISAFCCVANNFAANAKIAIVILRVLNRHRYFWAEPHVAVFH